MSNVVESSARYSIEEAPRSALPLKGVEGRGKRKRRDEGGAVVKDGEGKPPPPAEELKQI